ncbi:MAG: hypothetical protein NVS2B3_16310 [Vulcanimicrobiaceae bacterium]
MRVVTAEQMRVADAAAVARDGDVGLMRAAGAAIAAQIARIAPGARTLVAFAGNGNNGGDAYAAFACVAATVRRIVYATPPEFASPGRRDAESRARASGVVTRPFPREAAAARAALAGADLVLDALLGVGAHGPARADLQAAIEALAEAWERVLAIDVPSGIDATTGAIPGASVRARTTIALGAHKLGMLLEPARDRAGTIVVAEIGLASDVARVEWRTA